ncbi:hypothetical protein ACU3L3_07200 [Priestia endophytica]
MEKDSYTLKKVETCLKHQVKLKEKADPELLLSLIEQWKFDYEMNELYMKK